MEFDLKDLKFDIFEMSDKEYIAKYIKKNCIMHGEPYFLGKLPGTRYSSQYYLSMGLYNTEFMKKVAVQFHDIIKQNVGHFDFQITGREWSSIPLLSAIPMFLDIKYDIKINSFMIKRERKTYGMHNIIEGMPNDLPVLIVDDICNSTDSFKFCHNVITQTGLQSLPFIFAVLNKYTEKQGPDYIKEDRHLKNKIKPLSIVTGDDINNVK